MSELSEQRWAVLSERGVEATRVSYDDAKDVVDALSTLFGADHACIITSQAADRFTTQLKGT